jgi:NADH-quinone oxidoreductase subunit N
MGNSSNIAADLKLILPLLILWGAAGLILLGDVFVWKRDKDWNPRLALVGVVAALVLTLHFLLQMWGESASWIAFGRGVMADGLAAVGALALLTTAILSILMAWTYLKNRGLDHGEYYVLLLLSVSGAMLMAAANDLIVLFLGLEVLSFALYVLAGFARTEEKSEEASIKYFLLGAFASAFLLYGIALVYGATQTTNLGDIAKWAAQHKTSLLASPMMLAGIALLIVGLGFKAAVIPFHQWTPDVYEGAPTSVTAFMAGAAKIGAFAAVLRVFDALVPLHHHWLPAIQVIAILTMALGNWMAVTQTNVKRMLAYSSIAHAGYLLVAVAAMAHRDSTAGGALAHDLAVSGALFYLFAYTFMTLGAFGVLVYLSNRGKDYQTLGDLRGLSRHDSFAAYAMLFFMLSLGGIPPTMGFMGKLQIFMAALSAGEYALAIVMALTSAMAVYYYLRIVWMMTFEEPSKEAPAAPVFRTGAFASVFIAAAFTLLLGVAPDILNALTSMAR